MVRAGLSTFRQPNQRNARNIVIIATEGRDNKTEKNYFKWFNNDNKRYVIKFANGNETDPVNMVKALQKEIDRRGIDISSGDLAFCVIDTDSNPNKNMCIQDAKKLAEKYGIMIITSNPCFEFWFLLHYEETTALMNSEQLIEKLKKHINDYEKSMDIFFKIEQKMDIAIKRAKKIEINHILNKRTIGTVEACPNTEVYKIVEIIKN